MITTRIPLASVARVTSASVVGAPPAGFCCATSSDIEISVAAALMTIEALKRKDLALKYTVVSPVQ